MTQQMCFYVPGARTIQDGAIEAAPYAFIGQYSGESLDTMSARVPGVVLYDFEKACDEIKKVREAALCTPPVEITAEQYMDWLECLPPCKWTKHRGAECFFISEATDADIHQWCVKIGAKHWALNRSCYRTPESIIAEVADVI